MGLGEHLKTRNLASFSLALAFPCATEVAVRCCFVLSLQLHLGPSHAAVVQNVCRLFGRFFWQAPKHLGIAAEAVVSVTQCVLLFRLSIRPAQI